MKYNPYYIAARLGRRYLPESIAHKLLSRRSHSVKRLYHGEGNSSNSINYLKAIATSSAKSLFTGNNPVVILEAGSGLYNPISAPLILAGVSQLLLLEPYTSPSYDEDLFLARIKEFLFEAENDSTYPLRKVRSAAEAMSDLLDRNTGTPLVKHLPEFWENTNLPDSSVDLILSSSVLEHLRNPKDVMQESARILKPGGFMINLVDMRDHFFKYPVEMLKYSSGAWAQLTTRNGGSGYQNRLRINQWLSILEQEGFKNEVFPNITMSPGELNRSLPELHPDFQMIQKDDLCILHATIVSQKQ